MAKITLTDLVNLQNETTAVNAINNNNAAIEVAMENTLSRDGTSPNQMGANLDMNSHRILNLPVPVDLTEPLRKGDLTDFTQFQNSVNLAAALAAADADAIAADASADAAAISAAAADTSADAADISETNAAASAAAAAASAAGVSFLSIFSYIPPSEIPAIQAGTSTYDAGPIINSTLITAAGRPLYFPQGTYKIVTPIVYHTSGASAFIEGAKIKGDGQMKTIFQHAAPSVTLTNTFSTVNGSAIVTVNHTAHGKSINDDVTFMNLSSHNIGGCDFDGDWNITSVTANSYTFNYKTAATSTVNNQGTVTIPQHLISFKDLTGDFQRGAEITGIKIIGTGLAGASGIRLRANYSVWIDDVIIQTLTGDGFHTPCVRGDADGCNQIHVGRMFIWGCARWGVNMAGGSTVVSGVPTGYNEISFTTFDDLTVWDGGSGESSYLYGGGMKWKGQGLHFTSCAFATNYNVGIYIPGGSGLPSAVSFDFLVLENNRGRAFFIEGLDTMSGEILEIYQNDSFVATLGLGMDGTVSVVKNINVASSIIRATAGNNPFVAFNGTGANFSPTTTRVYTPSFQNFGHPGQTQVAGFTFRT